MDFLVDGFRVEDLLERYPLFQQRTSGAKQFTFLIGDSVVKGPYQAKKLSSLDERSQMLKSWKDGDPEEIRPYAENFMHHLQQRKASAITWLSYYMLASKDLKVVPRNRKTSPMVIIWEMVGTILPISIASILRDAFFKYKGKDERAFLLVAILFILKNPDPIQLITPIDVTVPIPDWTGLTPGHPWLIGEYEEPYVAPDYAVDKHTKRGRENGADRLHFANVGARVENQSVTYYDPLLKQIYDQ